MRSGNGTKEILRREERLRKCDIVGWCSKRKIRVGTRVASWREITGCRLGVESPRLLKHEGGISERRILQANVD